jgi:hypothetical protein
MSFTAIASTASAATPPAPGAIGVPIVLDTFDSATGWTALSSTQTTATLRVADGATGKALCLDYDFHGVSGYVGLQRALPLTYPADYAIAFKLRGEGKPNTLEFKMVDASGDNVWWINRPKTVLPAAWTPVRYKKRHVSKAWGPSPETELKQSAKLEFTLASGEGGKGSACFDELTLTPLQPDDGSPLRATSRDPNMRAALDDDAESAWRGTFAKPLPLIADLGRIREFGGLRLQWAPGVHASDYIVALSDDGTTWRAAKRMTGSDGGTDWIALPESEARYVRLQPAKGPGPRYGLATLAIEPLSFSATTNDFLKAVAAASPRGDWPRGFVDEQPYWTVVGVDGGKHQALLSEDGAVEFGRGGPSIEPFVLLGGRRIGWADVRGTTSLRDGYLPIPQVQWSHASFELKVATFAAREREQAQLITRYRIRNTTAAPLTLDLLLALRPLQVNPPSQFLNTRGGHAPLPLIQATRRHGLAGHASATGAAPPKWTPTFSRPADAVAVTTLDRGDVAGLGAADWSTGDGELRIEDPEGMASAAWRFRLELGPGETREVSWRASLLPGAAAPALDAAEAEEMAATEWHRKLDAVQIRVPPQGQRLVDTLRTALAHMLISREGPRLQPGTRSYSRAWIRDGAMINEALLRLGRDDVAKEFVRWYAPYQFKDGKVPCCVDDRGSDPVPENDSHGELIFAIAEAYRFTGDRKLLEDLWPNVQGAVRYMDQLRMSERTEANRAKNPAFYGMMPASISHEGYSAKPMHSYWDNLWALRGYKDAVDIAQWLGRADEAKAFATSRDQFANDLRASILAAAKLHKIEYIPGAAELGDFDATSTTIGLAPVDAGDVLPPDLLRNTFERYWRNAVARRDGTKPWKDYTPYELRTVGTFVRLGQPERAHAMLDFFFQGQEPKGWNQWAEVVSSTPRKPFFLGDIPHAWVGSDYVRSVLDMFAYARGSDDSQVIGAGIPLDWLAGDGVSIANLRTADGPLSYTLRSPSAGKIALDVPAGNKLPKGGIVLRLPQAKVRSVRVDGAPASWRDGEVRVTRAPARVELELAD